MNQIGKDSIIKKFEERFKRGYATWEKFRNKYDWGRKQYAKIKKLTHNRTGVGYDAMGRLEMADWWWDDRIKEWPDARKYRDKVIPNMDLFETEFGGITVTGEEGWSAQQGEASLSSRVNGDNDNEADSDGTDMAVPEKQTQPAETQTQAGNSRAKKRRRDKDVIVEACEKRTASLDRKNETLEKKYSIAEQMVRRWVLDDHDDDDEDDEDEDDDELGLLDSLTTERLSHRTDRGAGWRHVQQLMQGSDQQCYDILRMNQRTFEALCKMLKRRYGLQQSDHVYVEEAVAMFLEVVGQDKTVRDIAERYQRSLDTVKRKLDDVLSVLLRFAADTLKPEEGELTRVNTVLRDDDRYWPYFRDCIGALDGTHIPVRPPSQTAEAYRGRKGEPTMNVLAICNFDMKFIYAYVGVPGRAHDSKVLTHCAKNEPFFPHPPPGKYYLVDSGYPTRTGYLGPYRSMRYHLGQFARGPPVNTRELFNRKHSGLRSVIERTFGVWKAKWRILDRKHPKYGLTKWIKLVTATMALHNFVRDSHREDCDFVRWQSREEYQAHGDEEAEDDGGGGSGGGHVGYEATGDRAMEALRESIRNEYGNRHGRRLQY